MCCVYCVCVCVCTCLYYIVGIKCPHKDSNTWNFWHCGDWPANRFSVRGRFRVRGFNKILFGQYKSNRSLWKVPTIVVCVCVVCVCVCVCVCVNSTPVCMIQTQMKQRIFCCIIVHLHPHRLFSALICEELALLDALCIIRSSDVALSVCSERKTSVSSSVWLVDLTLRSSLLWSDISQICVSVLWGWFVNMDEDPIRKLI